MPKYLSKMLSTLFFIGYIPVAPGTFGTLSAFILVYFLRPDNLQLLMLVISGFFIGTLSSHIFEKDSGLKDNKAIIIDEFIGYLASLLFLPQTLFYLVAAFVLFRFFDILKPFPIKLVEKKISGGLGVMIDDIIAAAIVNTILQVIDILL